MKYSNVVINLIGRDYETRLADVCRYFNYNTFHFYLMPRSWYYSIIAVYLSTGLALLARGCDVVLNVICSH